jgi:DNA ligase (NAD+)
MNVQQQIVDLNARLREASEAYYKKNQPITPDADFDALERQLRDLVERHPEFAEYAPMLSSVGSDLSGGRIPHARPMLSIENKYDKNEIVEFFRSLPSPRAILEEPKRDGISACLSFKNGKLARALSRGDGQAGEDMTAQFNALKNVPKELFGYGVSFVPPKPPINLCVCGELVMRKTELDRINGAARAGSGKEYTSTRNLVAGTMKQKNLPVVASRDIRFIPWDVYSPDQDDKLPDSAYDRMKLLEKMGLPGFDGTLVTKEDRIIEVLNEILLFNEKSDIAADGVVAKVDSHELRRELGIGSKFTNWMCCFKPQNLAAITRLRNVIWQTGRGGKVTPVGIVDPVTLGGAVVTRVTLNNLSWIRSMNLKINSRIKLVRSGDVIPMVAENLDGKEI